MLDNGNDRPVTSWSELYTRCIEYEINHDNKTIKAVWQHRLDKFCNYTGSCRRMNNGNTIIG